MLLPSCLQEFMSIEPPTCTSFIAWEVELLRQRRPPPPAGLVPGQLPPPYSCEQTRLVAQRHGARMRQHSCANERAAAPCWERMTLAQPSSSTTPLPGSPSCTCPDRRPVSEEPPCQNGRHHVRRLRHRGQARRVQPLGPPRPEGAGCRLQRRLRRGAGGHRGEQGRPCQSSIHWEGLRTQRPPCRCCLSTFPSDGPLPCPQNKIASPGKGILGERLRRRVPLPPPASASPQQCLPCVWGVEWWGSVAG